MGGVGSRIQVLVVVLDDRGALSMFVELAVARRARSARALRSAPGSPENNSELISLLTVSTVSHCHHTTQLYVPTIRPNRFAPRLI